MITAVAAYWFQPMRFDLIPTPVPSPNPAVDPEVDGLFRSGARILVVTAHPDDSEYYLGGLLARLHRTGAVVHQVVCTDGDKGYYPWENAAENRRVRRAEQMQAAQLSGVKQVRFLGFPDGRLHPNEDVIAKIHDEIRGFSPTYVLAFDPIYPPRASHGDHRAAGAATVAAVKHSSVQWLLLFSTRAQNYAADVSDDWDTWAKAVGLHKSQFIGEKLDRVVASIQSDAMDQATDGKMTYAVGLRCLRPSK